MPLPTPRSVICSPNHIMNALPVVRVNIVIRTNETPGVTTKSPDFCRLMAIPKDWIALRMTVSVNTGRGDVRPEPVDAQEPKRKKDALAQIWNPKDVGQLVKHLLQDLE